MPEREKGELHREHPLLKPALQGMLLEGHPRTVQASLLEADCLCLGAAARTLRLVSLRQLLLMHGAAKHQLSAAGPVSRPHFGWQAVHPFWGSPAVLLPLLF